MLTVKQVSIPAGATVSIGKATMLRLTPLAITDETVNTYGQQTTDLLVQGRLLVLTGTRDDGTTLTIGLDHRGIPWTRGPYYGLSITNGHTATIIIDIEQTTSLDDPLPDERPAMAVQKDQAVNAAAAQLTVIAHGRKRITIATWVSSPTNAVAWTMTAIMPRGDSVGSGPVVGGVHSYNSIDATDRSTWTTYGSDAAYSTAISTIFRHYAIPAAPPPFISIGGAANVVGCIQRAMKVWSEA